MCNHTDEAYISSINSLLLNTAASWQSLKFWEVVLTYYECICTVCAPKNMLLFTNTNQRENNKMSFVLCNFMLTLLTWSCCCSFSAAPVWASRHLQDDQIRRDISLFHVTILWLFHSVIKLAFWLNSKGTSSCVQPKLAKRSNSNRLGMTHTCTNSYAMPALVEPSRIFWVRIKKMFIYRSVGTPDGKSSRDTVCVIPISLFYLLSSSGSWLSLWL